MPKIQLETHIKSNNIQVVFDLCRSIDLHIDSMQHTNEKAIAGRTSGLIELGETVTWRAKHFGFYQTLTSKITDCEPYTFFADELEKGIFHSFRHEHYVSKEGEHIVIKDIFDYKSPLGWLGKLADVLFLEKYMTNLLEQRNRTIKKYAETDLWKKVLKTNN
jgi:ligand-binding SRPBCC domain-containing protein